MQIPNQHAQFTQIACEYGSLWICRCIGATNKALAKRRAAEDALRIIAEKEAAVAAAAVAKQALELQAAIGMPTQEDMAIDDTVVPPTGLEATPPTAVGEAETLVTPDTPPQS